MSIAFLSSCATYRTHLEVEYFTRGEEAFKNKEYEKSLTAFKNAQEISRNYTALYRIAEIYLAQKKYDQMRLVLNTLMLVDRKNVLVQELNAMWYGQPDNENGNREKAQKLYDELLEKEITLSGRLYANIGIFYLNGQEYEKALENFRLADDTGESAKEMLNAYAAALIKFYRPKISEQPISPSQNQDTDEQDTTVLEKPATNQSNTAENDKSIELENTQNDESAKLKDAENNENAAIPFGIDPGASHDTPVDDSKKIDKTTLVISTQEQQDLNRVGALFIKGYHGSEITEDELMSMAETFVNAGYVANGVELHKELADGGMDIKDEIVVKSRLTILQLVVDKKYTPTDQNIPQAVLSSLEEILKELFPQELDDEQKSYAQQIRSIASSGKLTDALKQRIEELFEDYRLPAQDTHNAEEDSPETVPDAAAANEAIDDKVKGETDNEASSLPGDENQTAEEE